MTENLIQIAMYANAALIIKANNTNIYLKCSLCFHTKTAQTITITVATHTATIIIIISEK